MIGQNGESEPVQINPPRIAQRDNVLSVCVEIPSLSRTQLSKNPLKSSEPTCHRPRHTAC